MHNERVRNFRNHTDPPLPRARCVTLNCEEKSLLKTTLPRARCVTVADTQFK